MTMTPCHDGTAVTIPAQSIDTSGGTSAVATNLLTSSTYQDPTGVVHAIPSNGYPYSALWRDHHHHHYPYSYPEPGGTTVMQTGVNSPSAEKPHEVVQRALKEIAQATRALRDSAQAMGVPVDGAALEEAIVEKLRAAL